LSRLIELGSIDIHSRPVVQNPNGKVSTLRSASFNIDGKEVVLATVTDHGRILDERAQGRAEIIGDYLRTGKHLGTFDSPDDATAYAQSLHEQQKGIITRKAPIHPALSSRTGESVRASHSLATHLRWLPSGSFRATLLKPRASPLATVPKLEGIGDAAAPFRFSIGRITRQKAGAAEVLTRARAADLEGRS
jgi:hypothetical protein